MPSNESQIQQETNRPTAEYKMHLEDEAQGPVSAVRTSKVVSFHDMALGDMPTGLLDDVMREFFNETPEHQFGSISNGEDWYVYHANRTLDRAQEAGEALHGTEVTFWVTIKPLPGDAGPGRSYHGQFCAVNNPAKLSHHEGPKEAPPTANFQVNIVDDDDARAILSQIREKVADCAAALRDYEGDINQLELQADGMREAARLMERLEPHYSLTGY